MIYKKKYFFIFFFIVCLISIYFFDNKIDEIDKVNLNTLPEMQYLCIQEEIACTNFIEYTSDFNESLFLRSTEKVSDDFFTPSPIVSSNIFLEIQQDLYLSENIIGQSYRNEGAFVDVEDDESFYNRRIDLIVKNNGEFIEVEEYLSSRQALNNDFFISESTANNDIDFYLINKPDVNTISIGPSINVDDDFSFISRRD